MTVVKIRYPVGLQDMISMFRMCATARLFIDFMLPKVDAGIFLDTDILLMDDIKGLWGHFSQFSPSQVMGMAATAVVEAVRMTTAVGGRLKDGKALMYLQCCHVAHLAHPDMNLKTTYRRARERQVCDRYCYGYGRRYG